MAQQINLQQALGSGGSLSLAPGVYDLVGQSLLNGCYIQAHGVTFNVTDKAQSPILMGSDVTIDGGRFVWPDQDGSTPYPALITDPGAQSSNVTLRDVEIANAWVGFEQTQIPGQSWGAWNIIGGRMWACHDLFRLGVTGESWRIVGVDFSPATWGTLSDKMPGGATTAATGNTLLHVLGHAAGDPATSDGVEIAMAACTTFAWRRGIRVDPGGIFANSDLGVIWDGTATILDTWDGGLASGNVFHGSAICYTPDFTGGQFENGNAVAFALGSAGDLTLDGFPVTSRGGIVLSQGAAVYVRGCNLMGFSGGDVPPNTGAMIQVTDTSEIIVQNCRFDAGSPQIGIGGSNTVVEPNNVFRPNVRPSW